KENTANKENQNLSRNNYEESSKDKEERIQNLAEAKVKTCIKKA
ncbi:6232_t:CDS:1, partial [Scutellospora calospora]